MGFEFRQTMTDRRYPCVRMSRYEITKRQALNPRLTPKSDQHGIMTVVTPRDGERAGYSNPDHECRLATQGEAYHQCSTTDDHDHGFCTI